METAHTLASLRARAGLSLKDASAALGLSRQTLARYEADSSVAPAGFITQAAEFYGCPTSQLYVGNAALLAEHLMEAAYAEPPC